MFSRNKPKSTRLVQNRSGRRGSGPARAGHAVPSKFITGLVICISLALFWQFAEPELGHLTPVENVRIEGAFKNIPLARLRQQVMSVLSGGYFTVDITVIRNALLDLPWVEDVSVRRQWPSGLYIRVIEKKAVAFWGDGSLLSDRGELFVPASVDRDQPLPHFDGPEGSHQKVWAFMQEINREIEVMDAEVRRLVLDERRAWGFSIANYDSLKTIEVRLGKKNTAERLSRFVRIFSHSEAKLADIGFIDLRYPNGFAMRQKNAVKIMGAKNQDIRIMHARERGIIT